MVKIESPEAIFQNARSGITGLDMLARGVRDQKLNEIVRGLSDGPKLATLYSRILDLSKSTLVDGKTFFPMDSIPFQNGSISIRVQEGSITGRDRRERIRIGDTDNRRESRQRIRIGDSELHVEVVPPSDISDKREATIVDLLANTQNSGVTTLYPGSLLLNSEPASDIENSLVPVVLAPIIRFAILAAPNRVIVIPESRRFTLPQVQ